MEASTDNLNVSHLDMEASMENLNVAALDMEASMENLNVADLGMTEDDHEDHQIAPTIEETLGKKEVLSSADVLVLGYLRENEPVFVELDDVRNKTWEDPKCDAYFKKLRLNAINPTAGMQRRFYTMNQYLGEQLHDKADAFYVKKKFGTEVISLNLCMAPGGYTWSFLRRNRNSRAYGISLPVKDGGHPMYLDHGEKDRRVEVEWLDLTLLTAELGTPLDKVPAKHPEAAKFTAYSPFPGKVFDIVICDGNVLPIHRHQRSVNRESYRLLLSQLIFGLQRTKPGGNFIVLLHRVDSWSNLTLLMAFESFSKVQLWKAPKIHGTRSSFYLVAKNVHAESAEAKKAVMRWKEKWWTMTFAGENGTGLSLEPPTAEEVQKVLDTYGERWRVLGRPIWKTQLVAMKGSPFLNFSS